MKKEKIKQLPVFKEFWNYFLRRAKKVLKLRNSEFEAVHIDIKDKEIQLWFFVKTNIVARVQFTPDGKRYGDVRDNRKSEPEAEIATQGKPEDA